MISVQRDRITVNAVKDRKQALKIIEWIRREINETWENRSEITPSDKSPEKPKTMEVLKLLPQTNCGACGEPTCLVSYRGYFLVDKGLYFPEKWFSDDHKQRRAKCNLPDKASLKIKPELAVEMLDFLREENLPPFKYVLADSVYGVNPDFINPVDTLGDKTY